MTVLDLKIRDVDELRDDLLKDLAPYVATEFKNPQLRQSILEGSVDDHIDRLLRVINVWCPDSDMFSLPFPLDGATLVFTVVVENSEFVDVSYDIYECDKEGN